MTYQNQNKCFPIILSLVIIFSGCSSINPYSDYLRYPRISKIDRDLKIVLNNGEVLKLAYVQLDKNKDINDLDRYLSQFVNLPVEYKKASYEDGYLVLLHPLSVPECFEPGCIFNKTNNLNIKLIKSSFAKFRSPVKNPRDYSELKPFLEV